MTAVAAGLLGLSLPSCVGVGDPVESPPVVSEPIGSVEVDGPVQLRRLLAEKDADGDKRITVLDAASGAHDRPFELRTIANLPVDVAGTYAMSNLLQELILALDSGGPIVRIDTGRIWERPSRRIERSIRELYWDGLTRRIDEANLARILKDEKLDRGAGPAFLFVPHHDRHALEYFCDVARRRAGLSIQVERLPERIRPEWVRSLDPSWRGETAVSADPCVPPLDRRRVRPAHGLLTLALSVDAGGRTVGLPFVVPGGRFNEMYGWDSYFEALGLLEDGRVDLAKAMVDNFIYQIEHYGKILNANRTYYLTRSQPPFLTSMIAAVYERMPRDTRSRAWLRGALAAAIREYGEVWTGSERRTGIGLSRYFGSGMGTPPEVEAGHFDAVFAQRAADLGTAAGDYASAYRGGDVQDEVLDRIFRHDRCMRESGHDTTYRWDRGGNRCADFATVDLNSLLHKIEVDIARLIRDELGDRLVRADGSIETSATWYERARRRRRLMRRHLLDHESGAFFDYDVGRGSRHRYVSATSLYPLWAWNPEDPDSRFLSDEEASRLVAAILPSLEKAGGVAASSLESRGPISTQRPLRQWDYPHGWAPHQMLIWKGLRNHGFDAIADRLTYKWLHMITVAAVSYNGTVPEKFDVVRRSHRVFAEYGNVGTDFDYITREGFGWMNASYQVGLASLPPGLRDMLDRLVEPDQIDFNRLERVGPAARLPSS